MGSAVEAPVGPQLGLVRHGESSGCSNLPGRDARHLTPRAGSASAGEAWRDGLTTIIVLPCRGYFGQRLNASHPVVSAETRNNPELYGRALQEALSRRRNEPTVRCRLQRFAGWDFGRRGSGRKAARWGTGLRDPDASDVSLGFPPTAKPLGATQGLCENEGCWARVLSCC
jgi:hypothetical protein